MGKIIDIINKKYGNLTVLSCAGKHNGKISWNCKCDCGMTTIVAGGSLKSGNTSSCGCLKKKSKNFIDLTGEKFERLLVLEKGEKSYNSHYWKCICDCGKELFVNGCNLATGASKSCGCLRKEKTTKHGLSNKNWRDYRDYLWEQDPSRKIKHIVSNKVRKSLENKGGMSFFDYVSYTPKELKEHLESLWEPWMSWSNYGGKMNDKRKTWHIDHIVAHSKFTYNSMSDPQFVECWLLSNLRPLEKMENRRKWNK